MGYEIYHNRTGCGGEKGFFGSEFKDLGSILYKIENEIQNSSIIKMIGKILGEPVFYLISLDAKNERCPRVRLNITELYKRCLFRAGMPLELNGKRTKGEFERFFSIPHVSELVGEIDRIMYSHGLHQSSFFINKENLFILYHLNKEGGYKKGE